MILQKLEQAAQALPEPQLTFSQIQQKLEPQPRLSRVNFRRVAAVLLCLVLLVGCTGAVTYSLWSGGGGKDWPSAERIAKKYALVLPEQLGDSPFLRYDRMNLASQDFSWLLASIFPSYSYYSLDYGKETSQVRPAQGGGTTGFTWQEDPVSISFGSTEGEHWRQVFQIDAQNAPIYQSKELLSTEVLEYEGRTLYLACYDTPSISGVDWEKEEFTRSDDVKFRILWLEPEKKLVITVYAHGYTAEDVLPYVRQIIDLNV